MGRNWHSPKHFDFADSSGKSGAATGGQVVVVDREGAFGRPGQTIICFFNYSFQEALLSAYQSGRFHGEKIGEERARHTMREGPCRFSRFRTKPISSSKIWMPIAKVRCP